MTVNDIPQGFPEGFYAAGEGEDYSYAYICFTSDQADLSAATAVLGGLADSGWSKGDARRIDRGAAKTYGFSQFSFHSGLNNRQSFEAHLAALWQRIAPIEGRLPLLQPEWRGVLQFVGSFADRATPLNIGVGHLRYAALHGLDVDFDFYCDPMQWGHFAARHEAG